MTRFFKKFLNNKRKATLKSTSFNYKKYIRVMKNNNKGLMSKKQYLRIANELSDVSPCNLLVFGLGDDSYLWSKINLNGNTIFLEDDKNWIKTVNDGSLNVQLVEYKTNVADYKKIGFNEKNLKIDLPKNITSVKYDFIIVDAPLGHQPPRPYKGPGRMSSIFMASKLLKNGGVVVVDDMGRPIEREYAYHYFGKNNLKMLIENKVGIFTK